MSCLRVGVTNSLAACQLRTFRYSTDVETLLENEQQITTDIIDSRRRLNERTQERYGHHVRVSHSKSYGLAVGELTVLDNLPEFLAQRLFAHPGAYPILG